MYGRWMMPGVFERKLKQLNRRLFIFCGDDPNRPAGLHIRHANGTVEMICSVDKNRMPEYMIQDNETGEILKGGWRRVLRILAEKRLIRRADADRAFGRIIWRTLGSPDPIGTAIERARIEAAKRGLAESEKIGGVADPDYRNFDDMVDIARMSKKMERGE